VGSNAAVSRILLHGSDIVVSGEVLEREGRGVEREGAGQRVRQKHF
jgi:hypothetical protein